MTHNAAVPTGILANGTDLTRTDGRIIFRITRGLDDVPEVRGEDVVIPRAPGRFATNRRMDRLIIEAEGFVMGTGLDESTQRSDFRTSIEILRDVMNPTHDPYNLVVTVEDGSTRTITARPMNIVWGDDDIPTFREGTLQWESVDASDWGLPDGS